MARRNALTTTPPFEVEQALKRLGANLRTARLRRNLTLAAVGAKVGTGVRAIRDAEAGRPGASGAVYVAVLWAYGLLQPLAEIADPTQDQDGLARERLRKHAYPKKTLDNDF